jgi:integrase
MGAENRLPFSKRAIENLPTPDADRVYYYDTKTPGLALCITTNDVRTFYVYKRVRKKPTRIRLGRFPEVTVEQARTRATQLTGAIAAGADPMAREEELSCRELFEMWLNHAQQHKKTWGEDERLINKFLKPWRAKAARSITRGDVAKLHARVGELSGPYQANRVLSLVRAMFYHAGKYGLTGENPATGIQRFKEESRDRFLLPDELPRFFQALADEPDDTLRDFFLIALLVGARRGNVQAMRWNELNLTEGNWRIPDTKSGHAVYVYLPPAVVETLLKRREADPRGVFVFPSRSKTGHLVEPKTAWRRLLKRAGIENLRIHDLRRTLGSWQAINGTSLPVIGRSLGHKSTASTAVYARLTLEPVKASVDQATSAILAAAKGGGNG